MIQRLGGRVTTPKIGLGHVPSQPVKTLELCKNKQPLTQYITIEEANDDVGDNAIFNSK